MKNLLKLVFIVGLPVLAGSCRHYYYMPNTPLMPAFQNRHDAVLNVALCDQSGTEIQAAYSPLKYTAVLLNHMSVDRKFASTDEWAKGRLTEGGLGFYYGKHPWSVHLLGGYGGGFVENGYGLLPGNGNGYAKSRLKLEQYFIQPGFVLQTSHLKLGLVFRHVWLHYYKGDSDVISIDQDELNALKAIEERTPFSFTELGVTLGFRLRPFTFSYNVVSIIDTRSTYRDLHFKNGNRSVMVTLALNELWRKREAPGPTPGNK